MSTIDLRRPIAVVKADFWLPCECAVSRYRRDRGRGHPRCLPCKLGFFEDLWACVKALGRKRRERPQRDLQEGP